MRRPILLFGAGFIAALALARAPAIIASCYQPSENAPIILSDLRIDGEPAELPVDYDELQVELSAHWEGMQLSVLDLEGYVLSSETYGRRVR
jgi:hypothetical protein